MSQQHSTEYPWFAFYDKGVSHTVTIPETGLAAVLDKTAAEYGRREAIVFQNRRISYQELQVLAEQLAAALRKRGVKEGDRVSIMLPNLPQTFIAFWGVIKAGAIAVMTIRVDPSD